MHDATSAGIAALLSASRPAFLTLRLVGAAHLVYLGVTTPARRPSFA
jgi:threonine/homoserine/homoserine lactone efflux protein